MIIFLCSCRHLSESNRAAKAASASCRPAVNNSVTSTRYLKFFPNGWKGVVWNGWINVALELFSVRVKNQWNRRIENNPPPLLGWEWDWFGRMNAALIVVMINQWRFLPPDQFDDDQVSAFLSRSNRQVSVSHSCGSYQAMSVTVSYFVTSHGDIYKNDNCLSLSTFSVSRYYSASEGKGCSILLILMTRLGSHAVAT